MTPEMYQQLVDKIVACCPAIRKEMRCLKNNCDEKAYLYKSIQLADVLLALDRNGVVGFSIGARGDMAWNDGNSGASDDEVEFSIWDMRKPLSLQSDDTKMFLYNLLIAKK